MWKLSLGAALGLCCASQALACDRCERGHVGYLYYYAAPSPAGFHEYYGFYDSGYKSNADGGFYSVVGRPQGFRVTKHRKMTDRATRRGQRKE
jgi:hypothetical protein